MDIETWRNMTDEEREKHRKKSAEEYIRKILSDNKDTNKDKQ